MKDTITIQTKEQGAVVLTLAEMNEAKEYYDAHCTYDFVTENHPELSKEQAVIVSFAARQKMYDQECGEDELRYIDEAITEL